MSATNYEELKRHIGHNIECVGYGWRKKLKEYDNASIECIDCNEVLLDFDREV